MAVQQKERQRNLNIWQQRKQRFELWLSLCSVLINDLMTVRRNSAGREADLLNVTLAAGPNRIVVAESQFLIHLCLLCCLLFNFSPALLLFPSITPERLIGVSTNGIGRASMSASRKDPIEQSFRNPIPGSYLLALLPSVQFLFRPSVSVY